MGWLNLSDVSNFRKPWMDFEIDNKVSLSVKPVICVSHQVCTEVLEISPFLRKYLRLCTGITKNQSVTDSGLRLSSGEWI